ALAGPGIWDDASVPEIVLVDPRLVVLGAGVAIAHDPSCMAPSPDCPSWTTPLDSAIREPAVAWSIGTSVILFWEPATVVSDWYACGGVIVPVGRPDPPLWSVALAGLGDGPVSACALAGGPTAGPPEVDRGCGAALAS